MRRKRYEKHSCMVDNSILQKIVHDLPQDSERVTPNTGESQSATAKNELSQIDPDTYKHVLGWRLGESCFHDMPFPICQGNLSYTAESWWTKLRHSHIAQMNDKLHDQLKIRTAERPGVVLNGRVRGSTIKIMQNLETAICQSNFMRGQIKNFTITKLCTKIVSPMASDN